MLSIQKLQTLLESIKNASRRGLAPACRELFEYLSDAAVASSTHLHLESDRQSRWENWNPQRIGDWRMPSATDECRSLAWHLYRAIADSTEAGNGFLLRMYGQDFDSNVSSFGDDFFNYLVRCVESIAEEVGVDNGPSPRIKSEKFKILDSPTLLETDSVTHGIFGGSILYLDIDDFKRMNTEFTERVVDRTLLPDLQRLVARSVERLGYAYGEGGDEIVVYLPNASTEMGIAFAETLRRQIEGSDFAVEGTTVRLTISIGLAAATDLDGRTIADRANQAKAYAKKNGKNCTCVFSDEIFKVAKD